MKLVIDANILFSFFKKRSFTRDFILSHPEIEYFTPIYVFEELDKHKDFIETKAKIEDKVYDLITRELKEYVEVVDLKEIQVKWDTAEEICPDPNDIPYFAVSLYIECPLWSNDKNLKDQDKVKVLNTEELVEIVGEQ
ncbi:MAG: PIN domain-containing protein [Thermoplasmata archaeon]